MNKLKECPCGKTPTELGITDWNSQWAYCSGDCCGEWIVEFRTQNERANSAKCMEYAIKEWNKAPRGK